MVFNFSYYINILCVFIGGINWSATNIVGINYLVELLPPEQKENMFTAIFVVGAASNFLIPFQFLVLSYTCIFTSIIGIVSGAQACILSPLNLPESPKWLYSRERYSEAKQSIYSIGHQNGIVVYEQIKF